MRSKRWTLMTLLLLLSIVIMTVSTPKAVHSQTDAKLADALDEMMTSVYKPDAPGAALIAIRNGQVILRKGYGLANLELGVPVAPEMVFRLGSISKQFTAVAILMLAEEGKLTLDDEVTKFLPDFPMHGQRITIKHLLTHTAGIINYTDLPTTEQQRRADYGITQLINFFKDEALQFSPGTEWAYSNSGYALLGAIIGKAANLSYERFIEERIFKPLGMRHSFFDRASELIPGRVAGYTRGSFGPQNAAYMGLIQNNGAGALLSSVDDLALWDAALYTDKLVKQATLQAAFTPYILTNGQTTHYGYGWQLATYAGQPLIEHSGGVNGFTTYAIRLPAQKVFVAILTNTDSPMAYPDVIGFKMAALLSGHPYVEPVTAPILPAALDVLTGLYRLDDGSKASIIRSAEHIYWHDELLLPLSATEFFIPNSFFRLRFTLDTQGVATELVMEYRGDPQYVARKVK